MITCDDPAVFVSINVILATSNTRRTISEETFISRTLPFTQVL
jgi:hypothetical protein